MALGGGNFVTQNKILPGTYINFISAAAASASLSDRGLAALPIELDWGVDGAVFAVTAEEFQKDSMKYFGYTYAADELKGLRDLFQSITVGYFYKLMNIGVAASNTFAVAKYKGTRGNDITTVITVNVDNAAMMDVETFLGTTLVDSQTVLPNTDNLLDTDFVTWKSNVVLTATAGLAMTLGSNGSPVTSTEYQLALDAFESYSFNTIGCLSTESTIVDLMVAWTKRLRDEVGMKFQLICYQGEAADHEGIISVENTVDDGGALASSLVYWLTGAEAGCQVNKSLTNAIYTGEFEVVTAYTQTALAAAIQAGKLMFHKVGEDVRILEDINTFITVTDGKSGDFSSNQTIRVLDQIANDIATLFNTKYLGQIPNDADGRISLWNDIVKHHQALQGIRAIQDFDPADVVISAGDTKKSVVVSDVVEPVNAMAQLYMTVVVN